MVIQSALMEKNKIYVSINYVLTLSILQYFNDLYIQYAKFYSYKNYCTGAYKSPFEFLQKARFYETSPGYSNSKNPSQSSIMPLLMVYACT